MNAIILSIILGIVMMFSSVFVPNKNTYRHIATIGLILLLAGNIAELHGFSLFHINTKGMLSYDSFGMFFNSIAITSTLVYVLLTGRDIQKTGGYVAEYFVLIFFVLCGIAILSSYNNLLMLFLGIEILSIPLYILTGSDKRNMMSNEAALKYFLMGSFSTGLMLMGIALIYGATGSFAVEQMGKQMEGFAPVLMAGLLLLLIAMSFKVSAAPFHN